MIGEREAHAVVVQPEMGVHVDDGTARRNERQHGLPVRVEQLDSLLVAWERHGTERIGGGSRR